MNLLNEAFTSSTSPFELKFDTLTGIGVYARKDLSPKQDYKEVQKLLKGIYSTFQPKTETNWSMVPLSIPDKKRGRPQSEDSGRPSKNTLQHVSLIGPINFLNHACRKHSQVHFFPDYKSEITSVKVSLDNKVHAGQQVFMSYGVGCFKGVKCLQCATARKQKSKVGK